MAFFLFSPLFFKNEHQFVFLFRLFPLFNLIFIVCFQKTNFVSFSIFVFCKTNLLFVINKIIVSLFSALFVCLFLLFLYSCLIVCVFRCLFCAIFMHVFIFYVFIFHSVYAPMSLYVYFMLLLCLRLYEIVFK